MQCHECTFNTACYACREVFATYKKRSSLISYETIFFIEMGLPFYRELGALLFLEKGWCRRILEMVWLPVEPEIWRRIVCSESTAWFILHCHVCKDYTSTTKHSFFLVSYGTTFLVRNKRSIFNIKMEPPCIYLRKRRYNMILEKISPHIYCKKWRLNTRFTQKCRGYSTEKYMQW